MCWKKIKKILSLNKTKFGEDLFECPRCHVDLDKIKKNNVIIDVCKQCNGMWLDDKEINKLISIAKKRQKVNNNKIS